MVARSADKVCTARDAVAKQQNGSNCTNKVKGDRMVAFYFMKFNY
jgi:hypothetical protein